MSLGKREGSPEAARDVAPPAAKRIKDEGPGLREGRPSENAQAEVSLTRDEVPLRHSDKPLTPPTNSDESPADPVPQSASEVDYIICHLNVPDGVEVARTHSNTRTADKQVQAYAKLAGRNWTYYVQQLEIVIGRMAAESNDRVDIDLGPSKIVSRKHAVIQYNLQKRRWEVTVIGRNGVRVDGVLMKAGAVVPLRSGHVLDVGNAQMMFVLPDADPLVAPEFVAKARESRQQGPDTSSSDPPAYGRGDNLSSEPISSYPRGVAIVSRPQVAASQGFEQDLGSDGSRDIKPPFSYATMISQAILSTPDHMMSLADIYAWISRHYAFYRHSRPGWQNSIRHNLSLNKAFEKVARKENEPGKGSKWHIVPEYKEDLIRKALTGRQFKNRAVSPRRSPSRDVQPMRQALPSQSSIDPTTMPNATVVPSLTPASQGQTSSAGATMVSSQRPQGSESHSSQEPQRTQQSDSMSPSIQQQVPFGREQPQSSQGQLQSQEQPQPQRRQPSQAQQLAQQQRQQQAQQTQQQQAGFTMPMPFPDMNGFPMHPFQYMQPFGMPYMPQQPGQPPMIPIMPQFAPHTQTQPQRQYPADQHQFDNMQRPGNTPPTQPQQQQQQPQQRPDHESENRQADKPSQEVPSAVAPQSDSKTPSPTLQTAPSASGVPPPASAEATSETLKNTAASETSIKGDSDDGGSPHVGSETPARTLRSLGAEDSTQTPMLSSNVRLPPPNGSVPPESSPALWRYMNLESTPNNSAPANGGASRSQPEDSSRRGSIHAAVEKHDSGHTSGTVTSPPGSSPPGLAAKMARSPTTQEMPLLRKWEDNRA